ncbi:hypothetical protein [Brevibacillus sp. SYSU BS000544]|uniref:hypothetical protein n=1 Tax=Brevibacillus sp. SYSU BS000544 TaxID=3416443 RepID=UPI003CE54D0D
MIKVGEYTFNKKETLKETLNTILEYLRINNLIIVDEIGTPLSESQVNEQLENNNDVVFYTKTISNLEQETIDETLAYVKKVRSWIIENIEENNDSNLSQSFVTILEALLELEKVSTYFSIDAITAIKIQTLSQKALPQMEQGNEEYLRDLLEYEILPSIQLMEKHLVERKIN